MIIKKIFNKLGIDAAIMYTIMARVIQALGGLTTLFFIARYLTKVEQGYYYTFGSIIAIQIFFELGLSNIITQFVAHEKAYLNWNGTEFSGNEKALSRLAYLLKFCLKWFPVVGFFLFFVLLIVGFIFFESYGHVEKGISWKIPWAILSIATAVDLIISPIMAYIAGLGMVKEIAKIRLWQQIAQLGILYIMLTLNLKLYSSPIASVFAFILILLWMIFSNKIKILKEILKGLSEWRINYKTEIFPYQWKIALSWISGYFIFQLFNPVVFATEGAVAAGQLGMTLAIMTGILSIPMSWINTKIPVLSELIAKKNYSQLDNLFNRTLKQSSIVCVFCLLIFIVFFKIADYYGYTFVNRFLSFKFIILLSCVTFVNQFVGALATYLRCHKKEPLLIQSIVMGILTALSTLLLGRVMGLDGVVGGYTILTVCLSLPWAYITFNQRKREWHM